MGKTVLIIDDDESIVKLFDIALSLRGYEVFSSNDGVVGLTVAEDKHPDLILLDLAMPSLSGWEFLAALRKSASTKGIPVIVISALEEDIMSLAEYRVSNYIRKPLGMNEVVTAVKAIIGVPEESLREI